ncbi:MAG: tetratricopeptide repeat-containing glycosyltransferase family protein [Desulfuromonadaceae bacterium]|nr:tetratricopeptide repeat-containing glycosyltransferase family protein [Desulfuromonadaceae bacterium]
MKQPDLEIILQKANKAFDRSAPREALEHLWKALKISPDHPLILLRIGIAFHLMTRLDDAERFYIKSISCSPSPGDAYNNLGKLYLEMGDNSKAVVAFEKSSSLLPNSPIPLAAMATALHRMNKIQEAEKVCRHTIGKFPHFAEAHHNLSLLLLLQGKYVEGWKEYEWRWETNRHPFIKREFSKPAWTGCPIPGLRLLIHCEQGLGDTIQFSRYLHTVSVVSRARLVVACHPSLHSLLSIMNSELILTEPNKNQATFDYYISLLSLPSLFKTTVENIPFPEGYLRSPNMKYNDWNRLCDQKNKYLNVGICWSGNQFPDPNRSCPFEYIQCLLEIDGINFFSLQFGNASKQNKTRMVDLTPLIHDFSDTAALIDQLDLVISIDTAVAHLAGALGKRTWVLLPFVPDWRWGTAGDTCLWYKNIRLFRQKNPAGWSELMNRVKDALLGIPLLNHAQ